MLPSPYLCMFRFSPALTTRSYHPRTLAPTTADRLIDFLAVVIERAKIDLTLQAVEARASLLLLLLVGANIALGARLRYTSVVHSVPPLVTVGRVRGVSSTAGPSLLLPQDTIMFAIPQYINQE